MPGIIAMYAGGGGTYGGGAAAPTPGDMYGGGGGAPANDIPGELRDGTNGVAFVFSLIDAADGWLVNESLFTSGLPVL
jgi:hypothetical protein